MGGGDGGGGGGDFGDGVSGEEREIEFGRREE